VTVKVRAGVALVAVAATFVGGPIAGEELQRADRLHPPR